jgi:hypothetical protein
MVVRQMLLVPIALLLAACSGEAQVAAPCTEAGATSQVDLVSADGAPLPAGYSAEVCLEGVCRVGAWTEGTRTSVPLDLPTSGQVVLLVRTKDDAGQALDEASVSVEVESFSPNGKLCGPTVGLVQLSRTTDGAYTQVPVDG